MSIALIITLALAVLFNILNGIHDSSNIVATMISSRAFRPSVALGATAIAEFLGPFVFGLAVANTIGNQIISPAAITIEVLLAALLSAILWDLATWFLGIPSSSSHALIGGLIGAVTIGAGFGVIKLAGFYKIILALFASPFIGLFFGYLFTKLIFFFARNASPKINWFFKRSQILTGIALALSHGTNDGEKTMGIVALGLVITGYSKTFMIPLWLVTLCAGAIALGTALGGWRLIKTLGGKFYKIRPVHGFATQLTSVFVILSASLVGGPVSTTQVVSSAILGVGSAERVSKVRWRVAGDIALAWLVTIPVSALIAAGFYWALVNIPALATLMSTIQAR
ncbi:MAG: inorganic phosphate transporter [Chloroflexota bacterium]